MDMNYQQEEAKSHFEYVAVANANDITTKSKTQALQAMNTLEGWCSQEKAAVLMELIFMTKPQNIVEIGVYGGKSLIPMAFAMRTIGSKGKVYGVDPWNPQESAQGMDGVNRDWWSKLNHQAILDGLLKKISQYGLNSHIELIRTTSEGATPMSDIGLLHIDGNHSEKTSFYDVTKWVPYVNKGGIIIFDDITWGTTTKAVEWLDAHCTKIAEFKGDNVWGIWIKK